MLRRGNGAERRLLSGGSSPAASQITRPGLRRHVTSRLVTFSNVMLETLARPRSEDDKCVSVEKAEEQPPSLHALPPAVSLSTFQQIFFQPQPFSGEKSLAVCLRFCLHMCSFSGELRFLRWLCSVIAVTRGLLAETLRRKKVQSLQLPSAAVQTQF